MSPGDADDRGAHVLAQIRTQVADRAANVFDDKEVELGQGQLGHAVLHLVGRQAARAIGQDLHDRNAQSGDPAGVTGAGDARRIAALGIPVVQVLTDGACRLAAHQVQHGMAELPLPKLDLLIIEDVGGAVCHLRTDLGEHVRAAVVSIAGGHLVTTKYADAFRDARLILLTKYDLLSHVDFDLDAAVRTLGLANPGGEIICTDTRRRLGIDRAAGWLLGYVRAHRMRRLRRRAAAPVWLHT